MKHPLRALLLPLSAWALSAFAQETKLPLPPNYKTTFENADFLVMKVHYSPHEFVPMHDHSDYTTVYLYLNDSGEVQLKHEGPAGFATTRPPTHTGAWRISPGMAERHSVQNLSKAPSDFVRVELKTIPPSDIKKVARGEVPQATGAAFTKSEFQDAALRIDRANCSASAACTLPSQKERSLVVAIRPTKITSQGKSQSLQAGDVFWMPQRTEAQLDANAQCMRVSLLY